MKQSTIWPELNLESWQETYETVHLWTQVVGKIRLALTPWVNHAWHIPLYMTARGMTTSLMYSEAKGFQIDFDFVDHRLEVSTTQGEYLSFPLEPMSVASFYSELMSILKEVGVHVSIWVNPVELPDPVLDLDKDEIHKDYDKESIEKWWQIVIQCHRIFSLFRSRFIGKVSPVHFFWGAFDLAVTRFSGRDAPKHPGGVPNCADWVMEEAYSHEVSSAGFWPGMGLGEPAFYSYAYPEPEGFRTWPSIPEQAYFLESMGEYVLPYNAVRAAGNPDKLILDFLQSTYEAAADLAKWDRKNLEANLPGMDE